VDVANREHEQDEHTAATNGAETPKTKIST
jgi:hypothetical protein